MTFILLVYLVKLFGLKIPLKVLRFMIIVGICTMRKGLKRQARNKFAIAATVLVITSAPGAFPSR